MFKHYTDHAVFSATKFTKITLFASPRLMLGLNCFEPGQSQAVHDHTDQDKFYCVLEGEAEFVVGEITQQAGAGSVVWCPAGVPHGVNNTSPNRVVIFMGIAPAPSAGGHHHATA